MTTCDHIYIPSLLFLSVWENPSEYKELKSSYYAHISIIEPRHEISNNVAF